MALRKCKECGNPVSSKANKCPHCGRPVKKGGCLRVLALIILAIMILSIYLSDDKDTKKSPSYQPNNGSSTSSQDKNTESKEEKIIDTRICLKEALTDIPIKDANGRIIKTDKGIEGKYIRNGPGVKYGNDHSGPLWQDEKLYVLEEKDGWIRFRVTPKDAGWSAWIKKDLTVSLKEIHAERVAKFGKNQKVVLGTAQSDVLRNILNQLPKTRTALNMKNGPMYIILRMAGL